MNDDVHIRQLTDSDWDDTSALMHRAYFMSGLSFTSNFAGILIPIVIYVLVDVSGSFILPLIVIGVVALIGAFNHLVVFGKAEPRKQLTATTQRKPPPACSTATTPRLVGADWSGHVLRDNHLRTLNP
ncbi:hypothetical protein ACPESR_15620 [Nocardia testacea]|uniref:hypothetical protein n=1 Tax=Nocardia testacea TaxID=248551 RepID=UPI003C2B05B2